MRFIILCVLVFFSIPVFANNPVHKQDATKKPEGRLFLVKCTNANYRFQGENLVLNSIRPKSTFSIYLIQNRREVDILLNHQKKTGGVNAGWLSQISGANWSAIIISQEPFILTCQIADKRGARALNCRQVVKVCQLEQIAKENQLSIGDYWLSENKSLSQTLTIVRQRMLSGK